MSSPYLEKERDRLEELYRVQKYEPELDSHWDEDVRRKPARDYRKLAEQINFWLSVSLAFTIITLLVVLR